MSAWLAELGERIGPQALVTDADVVASHSRDQAQLVGAGTAACLVRARGVANVVAVLEVADRHEVPVVPRGAGSGLAGGANAVDGCIVLSVGAMDRIVPLRMRMLPLRSRR